MPNETTRRNGDGPTLARHVPAPLAPREEAFAHVVRDALDSTREIVRDTVALGVLEVRGAGTDLLHKAGETASDIGPRIAWATAAAVFGVVGFVLAIVALFMASEAILPSVPGRLGICAVIFLAVAGLGIYQAARRKKRIV